MPQASSELRKRMVGYFGEEGLEMSAPLNFLMQKSQGWKLSSSAVLEAPDRELLEKEQDCAQFLFDEWDFALVRPSRILARIPKPEPCGRCGQRDVGQDGVFPCETCGQPTLWNIRECAGALRERLGFGPSTNAENENAE